MYLQHARSFIAATIVLLTLAISGSYCALAETSAPADQTIGVSPGEITLGSCAPLSGQMAIRGKAVVTGGKAYFDYVNSHGGINGRKINLESCNDLYSADAAEHCFASCLKEKAFAGTLFQGSAAGVRYVKEGNQAKIPMVGFSMGTKLFNTFQPFCFQVRPSIDVETSEQVDKLWNELGCKKIALVIQNDAYGAAVEQGVLKALAKYSAAPVVEVSYQRLAENMDASVKKLHDAAPQAIIFGASGDALSRIARRRAEIAPEAVCVAMSYGTDLLVDEAGKAADGVLITQVVPFMQKDSRGYKLYEKALDEYEHAKPSASSIEGFMIAMVVCEGLKKAGKDLTRERFVHALESIHDFDMGFGPDYQLSYSPTNHSGLQKSVYWTVVKNGNLEPVHDLKSIAHK